MPPQQGTERLTLTVEEAATALGISRALAYESVRRGEIPHIEDRPAGPCPQAALQRLLSSADPDSEGPDPSQREPSSIQGALSFGSRLIR